MKSLNNLALLFLIILIGVGCKSINRDPYADTPTSGKIKIGIDETFRPVADAEVMVFEGLYHYAEITPIYGPEKDCFKLLIDDSVKLIIASRTLKEEEKIFLAERKIIPREIKIATDAIALIVNPANDDTLLSMGELHQIIVGKVNSWKDLDNKSELSTMSVVFDNKYSSIVSYVIDSIGRGETLTGNLYALDSNLDVVDFVSRNVNALGLIGVSWISDQDDSTQLSFLKKVRVISLSFREPATVDNSYKPYQAYIYDGSYPLSRDVYAIDTEPRNGLATGFLSFLASDKGQRIILKTGILPATAPVRVVNVRENL